MNDCPRVPACAAKNVAVVECIWCDGAWCSECRDDIPHGNCCRDVPVNPYCTLCNRSGPGKYYANRGLVEHRLEVFCQSCWDEYVRDLEEKEFCGC
jgi:hypothetical protein